MRYVARGMHWNPESVRDAFVEHFGDANLVLVSNRQPYVHKHGDGGITVERSAGGLTRALDPVLQAVGGTWIAWGHGDADPEVVDDHDRVGVPPENPSYVLRRIWLSKEDVERYYLGFSNQALWPLCHNILEHVRFRDRFWERYIEINDRFARAVVEEAQDDDALVWLQDYHFALAPRAIRILRPHLTLAHFWHIPWPAWETFRICPRKHALLAGLLANDLLVFHLGTFAQNFLDACAHELDAIIDWGKRTIVYRGHATQVRALPISIDTERFERMAASDDTVARIARIRKRYALEGQKVGIGVDRLDYSKGILERLEALRFLFRDNPDLRGRFTFIQVAVPTRSEIPAYQHLQERVEERIAALNDELETGGWTPIVYIDTPLPQHELAAYYRLADLAIVSSVMDGMNLVVKEFIACQDDEEPGAVCLSEFAGAFEHLDHSIRVNPFYTEGFAKDIRKALEMKVGERRRRMAAMKAEIRENTVYRWMGDFIEEAARARAVSQPQGA